MINDKIFTFIFIGLFSERGTHMGVINEILLSFMVTTTQIHSKVHILDFAVTVMHALPLINFIDIRNNF